MRNPAITPRLSKWPFVLGDLVLIGAASTIVLRSGPPLGLWQAALCLAAIGTGAYLITIPFLREYHALLQLAEADKLATSVGQIKDLERIKSQLGDTTAQWHTIQENSTKALASARELSEKMGREVDQFCAFLKKSNDGERNHLRLEVEKLRRSEADWLQVSVHLLDHIFALNKAAGRSGQPTLIAQLEQFQLACRDIVRRMGVVAFAPQAGEGFDERMHQLADPGGSAVAGQGIVEVLGPGYTYQGQLVRKALVRTGEASQEASEGPLESGASIEGQQATASAAPA